MQASAALTFQEAGNSLGVLAQTISIVAQALAALRMLGDHMSSAWCCSMLRRCQLQMVPALQLR